MFLFQNYDKCTQPENRPEILSAFEIHFPSGKSAVFRVCKEKENWQIFNGISTKIY